MDADEELDDVDAQYLMRANDLIGRIGAERAAIVEGLLPANSLCILAGQTQTAKSYLALEMADAVASGEPFAGTFGIPLPGNVAYFSLENSLAAERRRLIARGHTAERSSDIYIHDFLDISDATGIKAMERALRPYRPRLIVIDTARPALNGGAIIAPGKIREKIGPLRAFAHRPNPPGSILLLLHNNQKNTLDGGPQWRANSDLVFDIRQKENLRSGDLRQYIEIQGRDATSAGLVLDMDRLTKRFRLHSAEAEEARSQAEREAKLRERMAKYLPITQALIRAGGHATTVQIEDAVGMTYKVAQVLVREMRERGMIVDSGLREGVRRNIIIYRLTDNMDAWARANSDPEQADYEAAAALFASWGEEAAEDDT